MAYVSVDFIALQGEPEKWITYQRSVQGVNKAVVCTCWIIQGTKLRRRSLRIDEAVYAGRPFLLMAGEQYIQ